MSLDLVIHGPRADIRNLFINRGWVTQNTDEEGNISFSNKPGLDWVPWNGSGQVMRVPGVYDSEGVEITPPTYVPGYAVIVRLSYSIEEADRADDGLDEDGDTIPTNYRDTDDEGNPIPSPWSRSKLLAKLRKVGRLRDTAGMPNYQLPGGLRVFRYSDVQDKCVNDWGTPGHVFL